MPLLPIRTERLVIRMMRPSDAAVLAEYRNHPDVARYQSWELPHPASRASEMLAMQAHLEDLPPQDWVQLAVERNGVVIGDVAVSIISDGRVAKVACHFRTEVREPVWCPHPTELDEFKKFLDVLERDLFGMLTHGETVP